MPINYLGDYAGGGMMLAFGMVAALLAVQRGGEGQVIDAAMSDGAALIGALTYGLRAAGAWRDERESNLLDGGEPDYGIYRCLDGKFLSIGAIEPQFRERCSRDWRWPRVPATKRSQRSSPAAPRDAVGGAFRGHRRLRRARARSGRSAGPSAQSGAADLHRPRRRVPACASAALFRNHPRPARSAAARGAGRGGDPCRARLWRGRNRRNSASRRGLMHPLYEQMETSVFERMSLAAAKHGAVNLGQGFPDFGWPPEILEAAAKAVVEGSQPICAVARACRRCARRSRLIMRGIRDSNSRQKTSALPPARPRHWRRRSWPRSSRATR